MFLGCKISAPGLKFEYENDQLYCSFEKEILILITLMPFYLFEMGLECVT